MFRILFLLVLTLTPLLHPLCYSTSGLQSYQLPCSDLYLPPRVDADGLLWNHWRHEGHASLFIPFFQPGDVVFFLQGGAGRFLEEWTASVGGGVRWAVTCGCQWVAGWGINAFADYAYCDSTLSWWQGGGGAELFGGWWELRVNGYLPQTIHSRSTLPDTRHPVTRTFILRTDHPLAGLDSEGGVGIKIGPGALWGYAGYFRFEGQEDHPILEGPRFRLEYELNIPLCWGDGEVCIAGEWETTKRFGGQASLYFRCSLPLGCYGKPCRPCINTVCRQLGRSVRRQNGIVLFTNALPIIVD